MDDLDVATISTMKVAELKKELKSRNLPIAGNKNDLIERLQMAVVTGSDGNNSLTADSGDPTGDLLLDLTPPVADHVDLQESEAQNKRKVSIKRDSTLSASPKMQGGAASGNDHLEKIVGSAGDGKRSANVIDGMEEAMPTSETNISPGAEKNPAEGDGTVDTVVRPEKAQLSDEERAKARAERFGICNNAGKASRSERFSTGSQEIGVKPSVDAETLKRRSERFGQITSPTAKELVVMEKIKKRQDRFGIVEPCEKKLKVGVNENLLMDERMKKRREKFGDTLKA